MGFFDSWSDLISAATPWSEVEAEAPAAPEEEEEVKVCYVFFARVLFRAEGDFGMDILGGMCLDWLLRSDWGAIGLGADGWGHGAVGGWQRDGIEELGCVIVVAIEALDWE